MTEQTTFEEISYQDVDMVEIERRANQLRAEAMSYGLRTTWEWVASKWTRGFGLEGQKA